MICVRKLPHISLHRVSDGTRANRFINPSDVSEESLASENGTKSQHSLTHNTFY